MLREQLQSAQVVAIGLEVGGWRSRQGLLLGAQQIDLQRRNDLVRDVILDGEDVGQRSVVASAQIWPPLVPLTSRAVIRTRSPARRTLPSST